MLAQELRGLLTGEIRVHGQDRGGNLLRPPVALLAVPEPGGLVLGPGVNCGRDRLGCLRPLGVGPCAAAVSPVASEPPAAVSDPTRSEHERQHRQNTNNKPVEGCLAGGTLGDHNGQGSQTTSIPATETGSSTLVDHHRGRCPPTVSRRPTTTPEGTAVWTGVELGLPRRRSPSSDESWNPYPHGSDESWNPYPHGVAPAGRCTSRPADHHPRRRSVHTAVEARPLHSRTDSTADGRLAGHLGRCRRC